MYEVFFFNGNPENEKLMNAIFRNLSKDLRDKVNFNFISKLNNLADLNIKNGCCVIEPYMNGDTQFCLERIEGCKKRGLKVVIYSTQIMEGALPQLEPGVHYDLLVENSKELLGLLEKLILE